MTDEVLTRKAGRCGRITLNRPQALNALTHAMCLKIENAIDSWAKDDAIDMLVIDAAGDRAFCAGGDIAAMYHLGVAGNFEPAEAFWRDEYRLNAKLFRFPKPVASFMQGFVMGGGVGIGGHGSHRVVGETSKISMPECAIGLVPDVGGSLLLARAPGRMGEYLGLTGFRMQAADAIYAGFADYLVPEAKWPELIRTLEASGDWTCVDAAAQPAETAGLADRQSWVDTTFAGTTLRDVYNALEHDTSDLATEARKLLAGASPLSAATTLELVRRSRGRDTIEGALELEYRGTTRALRQGDFLEGVRAMVIDKDKAPNWKWGAVGDLPSRAVVEMLLPLGDAALKLEEAT